MGNFVTRNGKIASELAEFSIPILADSTIKSAVNKLLLINPHYVLSTILATDRLKSGQHLARFN